MKKLWMIAPLVACVATTPAYAQPGVSARAEVRVGYDEFRSKVTVLNEAFTDDFGVSGISYGGEVGVDLQVNEGLFAGAYAGVDFSDVDGCEEDIIPAFRPGDIGCVDAGRGYTAGLRAGVDAGGGRAYVKGGLSRARLAVDYTDDEDNLLYSARGSRSGWHVGAGVELDVTRNFYVKGEYVHHSYKAMASELAFDGRARVRRHQILAGIGIRFGGAAALPPPPPPPPPPPVEAAPAMQTCPDGSVVMATDVCPLPPPPPPPPPAPGERG